MNKIIVQVNKEIELAQDSYYTRNPGDPAGDIGPECPKTITVSDIMIERKVCEFDGDVWFDAKVDHDFTVDGEPAWEIYSDTGFDKEITKILKKTLPEFMETRVAQFSEQGMQKLGQAHMDLIDEDASTDFVDFECSEYILINAA